MTYYDPGSMDEIVRRSTEFAKFTNSSYMTLEHLLLSLLEQKDVIKFCEEFNVKIDAIKESVSNYISEEIQTDNYQMPKPTKTFAEVLQISIIQAMHKKIKVIDGLVIMESLLKHDDSHASYFAQVNGIDISNLEEYSYLQSKIKNEDVKTADEKPKKTNSNNNSDETEEMLEVIEEFCTFIGSPEYQKNINPLVGRNQEIGELELVLSRKTKSNAILVGPPGTGKSAIVEGLAKMIMNKETSESMQDVEIWNLEVTDMIAGTKYRGEMEERLNNIIDAFVGLSAKGRKMVVFIDEIHSIVGSGNTSSSSLNMGDILKPALARGGLKVIGATTDEEYRKHFEKDKALSRRFQKVAVAEPSEEDTINIIMGIKKYYESFHGVKYDKASITEAVKLSSRYIVNKYLPDKAIDIVDLAGAKAKLSGTKKITKKEIEEIVSKVAKLPEKTIKEDDSEKLKNLKTNLEKSVIGQDEAVEELVSAVIMNRMGLRERGKPQGSYLFQGPTGTGKTHLVKQLAQTLNMNFVRFDMSEFMEKHSISKLIGSPPGYAGYDSEGGSGQLISAIEKNPYSIILLDEIEKADKSIFNLFLQVMDDARLTSGDGKTISCENIILIMTSNIGAAVMNKNPIGFGNTNEGKDDAAIENLFTPEFRNRLDAIVKFKSLSEENIRKVVDIEISSLVDTLKSEKVKLKVTTEAKNKIAKDGYDPKMGARPLKKLIQDKIKKPLSMKMLMEGKKTFSIDVDETGNFVII